MNKKLFGFTLAEVLITLAIIGVVASLTLPTLLANYNKREWATKLIKTHAELTQGFKLMMAQNNTSELSQTEAWTSMPEGGCRENNIEKDVCNKFIENFSKVFDGSYVQKNSEVNYPNVMHRLGTSSLVSTINMPYSIKLKSGIFIIEPRFFLPTTINQNAITLGGKMYNQSGMIYVDVNGEKGPNTIGRDIFKFRIANDGNIYPQGCRDLSIYNFGNTEHTWDSDDIDYNCNTKLGNGLGCAARVLETGKMDY